MGKIKKKCQNVKYSIVYACDHVIILCQLRYCPNPCHYVMNKAIIMPKVLSKFFYTMFCNVLVEVNHF